MPHQERLDLFADAIFIERIDPFEAAIFRLIRTPVELRPQAARIIEEGLVVRDLMIMHGRKPVVVTTAVLVRAMRPPFRLPDRTPFGKSEEWDIEHL